jgi:uncharacterized protein YyaL (SSP411 family)
MEKSRKPNALIKEKSPYLLQHAYNPVNWFPWGDVAIEKANTENKPIFLSIGYSTCHWCHVMAKESFENEEIARILNSEFISIKVDREERPDLDEMYMKAVMTLTGQGGWPLSVFLTPDLKPFYGGTYFPPVSRHGLPSFSELLQSISRLWKENKKEIEENAKQIISLVKESYSVKSKGTLLPSLLDNGYATLVSAFDSEHGGFGSAPKFPLSNYLHFLMRYYLRTRKKLTIKAVAKTLDAMRAGGIHDHLGGGYHRYSTDRQWLVPHFEKMLYDNALLAKTYIEAYQITKDNSFLESAQDTLRWLLNEMRSADGAFFSAQDADTEDGEGFYYTWTEKEIKSALEALEGDVFCYIFGVSSNSSFDNDRSILHVTNSIEAAASRFNLSSDRIKELLNNAKQKLLQIRLQRARPAIDDKIITSWNGLAISAFAYAYQSFRDESYLEAAKKCAKFILNYLIKDGVLYRRYRGEDVAIEGTLEDYSFLIMSLIDLYESSFEAEWIEQAIRLSREMINLFWDDSTAGFFLNSKKELPAHIKEGYDGPIPSGNSIATLVLLKLGEFTGNIEFKEKAEKTLRLFADLMEEDPSSHTFMLSALDFYYGPTKEIVLVSKNRDDDAKTMIKEIHSHFIPNKIFILVTNENQVPTVLLQLVNGKLALNGKPTIYICENFACKNPISDIETLKRQLEHSTD